MGFLDGLVMILCKATVFTWDRGALKILANKKKKKAILRIIVRKKWTPLLLQKRISLPCYTGNVFCQQTHQVYCLSWRMELPFHSRRAPTIPVITHNHVISSANWWGTCIYKKGNSTSNSHLKAKTKSTFETADACFLRLFFSHFFL